MRYMSHYTSQGAFLRAARTLRRAIRKAVRNQGKSRYKPRPHPTKRRRFLRLFPQTTVNHGSLRLPGMATTANRGVLHTPIVAAANARQPASGYNICPGGPNHGISRCFRIPLHLHIGAVDVSRKSPGRAPEPALKTTAHGSKHTPKRRADAGPSALASLNRAVLRACVDVP